MARPHQHPLLIILVDSHLVLQVPTLNLMEEVELSILVPLPLLLRPPPLEPHPEINRRQIMVSTAATMHLEDQIRTQRLETFNSVHLTHLQLLELRKRQQIRLVATTTTTTHQRQHSEEEVIVVCHLA